MAYTLSCCVLNARVNDGKGELLVEAGPRMFRVFCSVSDVNIIDTITGPYIKLTGFSIVKGDRPGLKIGSYESITEQEYLKKHHQKTTFPARARKYSMAIYKNSNSILAKVEIEQGLDASDPKQFESLLQKAGKMLDTHLINHDSMVIGGEEE